jgi:DNA-binding MarR family transcriptional regulator
LRISKTEYEALAEFRYAVRQFLAFSEEAAKSVGLTPRQHQALLAIRGAPGRQALTIGELAERLHIQPNSAVGLVDRLEADDLVTRASRAGDRRQVFVSLTPRGRSVLEQLSTAHRAELRRVGPRLRALLESLGSSDSAEG